MIKYATYEDYTKILEGKLQEKVIDSINEIDIKEELQDQIENNNLMKNLAEASTK